MRFIKRRLGRKGVLILIGILVGGSVILGFLLDVGAAGVPVGTGWLASIGARVPTIGIIYIDGIISGGTSSSGLFGVTTGSDDVVAYLKEATDDPSVRAVVLRVNSPGGSAPAAQEISREIQKLKDAGKAVVVSMGDVAASGAYYISAGADMIMANPGTITGSIGAIMSVTNVEELYRKIGVREETIKSGPHKDIGSGTRPMTEEERRILEELVNTVYRQFLEAVANGRGMSLEELKPIADGRILTGSQAKEVGLVDEIGNFQDAI
ncbi:MAG TPA: signal peptide peptidase SppA, partial [Clostridia bacterium]|nr:signal peptide peptidase SppA [Clostridia bacterium]